MPIAPADFVGDLAVARPSAGRWPIASCHVGSKSWPTTSSGSTPRRRSASSSCRWISSTPLRQRAASPPSSARRRRQRALEVVDHRQQVADQIGRDASDQLAPLAFGALAVVVELGGGAEQPVLQLVALPLERRIGVGRDPADLRRRRRYWTWFVITVLRAAASSPATRRRRPRWRAGSACASGRSRRPCRCARRRWNVEATRLNGCRSGDDVLRADDDRQAAGFDRAREQLDQPMLLFDHPEQRAQRLQRALAIARLRRRARRRGTTRPARAASRRRRCRPGRCCASSSARATSAS